MVAIQTSGLSFFLCFFCIVVICYGYTNMIIFISLPWKYCLLHPYMAICHDGILEEINLPSGYVNLEPNRHHSVQFLHHYYDDVSTIN